MGMMKLPYRIPLAFRRKFLYENYHSTMVNEQKQMLNGELMDEGLSDEFFVSIGLSWDYFHEDHNRNNGEQEEWEYYQSVMSYAFSNPISYMVGPRVSLDVVLKKLYELEDNGMKILNTKEVAEAFGVSVQSVTNWVYLRKIFRNKGKEKDGNKNLFAVEHLIDWVLKERAVRSRWLG